MSDRSPAPHSDSGGQARPVEEVSRVVLERSTNRAVVPVILAVVAVAITAVILSNLGGADADADDAGPDVVDGVAQDVLSVPQAVLAAERFMTSPGPAGLRRLLESIGGVDALTIDRADGAFDLVTFDPLDPNRLLASHRSSYGPAENQDVNEEWSVENGSVVQRLYTSEVSHDVVHFNADGTIAVWANSGNSSDFASRTVSLGDRRGTESDPVYASRAVVVDGSLFALTGSDDYYSSEDRFRSLIVDGGDGVAILDDGAPWEWLDSPERGIVVSYPRDIGTTAVWTSAGERLVDHPLAGLTYRRLALSGDGSVGVGIRFDGALEVFDPTSGAPGTTFGALDPTGIVDPIRVSNDGSTAATVATDGTVTLWWVGHDRPVLSIEADAGPARVVSERRAPRASSAIAPGARRAAVRVRATGAEPTHWLIVDLDPQSWIAAACGDGRPALTLEMRRELGLSETSVACS